MTDINEDVVRLVSSDGFVFIVEKKAAMISAAVKNMLSGPGEFVESSRGEINFPNIRGKILEKVCQYFYFKLKYANSSVEIPEFAIEPDIALELLMAANFLDT